VIANRNRFLVPRNDRKTTKKDIVKSPEINSGQARLLEPMATEPAFQKRYKENCYRKV
jgi:hypothetical protein